MENKAVFATLFAAMIPLLTKPTSPEADPEVVSAQKTKKVKPLSASALKKCREALQSFLRPNGSSALLEKLFPADQAHEHTASIYACLRKIRSQFKEAICSLYRKGPSGVTDWDMLSHAQKLHISLFGAKNASSAVYFPKKLHSLPRSLVISPRGVYVLSKQHGNMGVMTGTFKKVTSGCLLHKNSSKITPVANAVNRTLYTEEGNLDSDTMHHILSINKRDAQLQKRFYDKSLNGEGIWPILDVQESQKVKNLASGVSVLVPKLNILSPRGTRLSDYLKQNTPLSERLEIIRQLCVGLSTIHAEGYIHGDIKSNNVLCGPTAGFIDFGNCFKVGTPLNSVESYFDLGFYGSIIFTAPEFFGNKDFTGDLKAVEMFAFGMLVYYIFYRKLPPWIPLLNIAYKANVNDVSDALKALFQKTIIEKVEARLEALRNNTSQEAKQQRFVLGFFRLNPAARFTSHEALEAVTQLRPN